MPGPFTTFGNSTISPGTVSYASIALTASISLAWPNFSGVGTNVAALVMDITANANTYNITMPDATQAGVGTTALFRNTGAQTVTILANDATVIGTVAAGVAKFIYLQTNATSGGSWGIVTFGAGTSAADASLLAGFGLQAISATLNQSHPTTSTSAPINITSPASLAQAYVAIGGSVACNLPTSASAGPNFFFLLKNNGSGTLTITPSGGDVIDTVATLALAPGDSCMVCSLGSANGWISVGYGRSVSFAFTQLVKSVAGGADVVLTAAECANKLMTFTGLLTGNINVIVTNTISVYYLFNNTTGAFTLTVKTAAGTGIAVAQGTHDVGVCDGTNVYRGITNTAGTTAFAVGSAGAPSVTFLSNTSTGIYVPSAGVLGITANSFEVMSFNSVAGSVNWIDVFASATTTNPSIVANGTDASVGLLLKMKGTGAQSNLAIQDGSGKNMSVFNTVGSAVNYLASTNAATGSNPLVTSTGTDGNIGQRYVPKGTGRFQITDGTDATKVGEFVFSGLSTGTVRSFTFQDSSDTIVGRATTDTLTNKTLTSAKSTVQALTPGASVAVDMSLGTAMTLTLGAAANAFAAPSNLAAGQWGWITLKQDATGNRVVAWNAAYKFVGGVAPINAATGLSSAANAVDRVYWVCDDGATVQCTFGKGFA